MTGIVTLGYNTGGIDAGEVDYSIACARLDNMSKEDKKKLLALSKEVTDAIRKSLEGYV
jgi:hypothetical protein